MNKNVIYKSIKICYKECPLDSILLALVSIILSVLPSFILFVYNTLISNLNAINTSICLIVCYCFLNFLQKSIYNIYNHYYLNYYTLLKFEKKMKQKFFIICSKINLEEYLIPEVVNETRRAQNASINIFRVYQIVVEIISAIIGVMLIGRVIFSVHFSLIIFFALAIISPIADNVYQIIQKRFLLYKNTQKQKEDDAYIKILTKPEHIKELKVLNCFNFIFEKWLEIRRVILDLEKKAQTKIFVVSFIFNFLKIVGTIGAYWNITYLLIKQQINLAEFSMAILTFSQITQLFNQFFSLLGNLSEFSMMVKPYFLFFERTTEKVKNQSVVSDKNRAIVLQNISYKYPHSDSWALKDINLTINSGELISIVGENGSGKTTLSKIILGFLRPTKGDLERYIPVTKTDFKEDYLETISYIPQQFNCYCISIKDNILFGKYIDNDLLNQALEDMGLEDLTECKNTYYGLEFGGIELSGGQKQRIAILRSMFKKSDIFIFDEPTSAIDPLQESFVYRAILNIAKYKTVIIISHRLALSKESNLIVVLKDGQIIETGNHEILIEKNGEYANMWKTQSELYLK